MLEKGDNSDTAITEVTLDSECPEKKIDSIYSDVPSHSNSPNRLPNIGFFYKEISCSMVCRESFFFLALVLTTYGALYNAPPKISRQPFPMPFFYRNPAVKDWYKGQLSAALSHMITFEVSFVMYYAPWDAECQHTRHEFLKVAQILGSQIHFSAVNCWNPGSECRVKHAKVPSWPVLMVYTSTSKSIMYKGPRNAQSMIRFLQLILRPIHRVNGYDDLHRLAVECEAVVVGYVPLEQGSRMYNMFYSVALKMKERDPFGELCFAAVTSEKTAHEMDIEYVPNIHLLLWNETLEYSSDDQMTEEGVIHWLWFTMARPSARVMLPWVKSNTFQPFIEWGPAIILFTPINPLYKNNGYYNLFRAASMDYHNCEENPAVNEMILRIEEMTEFQENEYRMLQASCDVSTAELLRKLRQDKSMQRVIRISNVQKRQWLNKTSCKNKNLKNSVLTHLLQKSNNYCAIPSVKAGLSGIIRAENAQNSPLKDFNINEDDCKYDSEAPEEKLSMLDIPNLLETSMLPKDDDTLSSVNLKMAFYEDICRALSFAERVQKPFFPKVHLDHENITGLVCKSNKTLSFIALDSFENHHFAESLGIDIDAIVDKTAVIILDHKEESQYVMKEPFTTGNVRTFIRNFIRNGLTRSLKTVVPNVKNTHHYCLSGEKCVDHCVTSLCIAELTSHTFLDFILEPKKLVIAVHCGGSCDPHTSRAMLAVSRVLKLANVDVKMGLIDAAQHDLPWSFTASKYPAIVVYPAYRKYDSRLYPPSQRISTEGLLAVVLDSLDPPSNMRTRLVIARQAKNAATVKRYLGDLRAYVANLINSSLRQWRRLSSANVKAIILRRLQSLRTVSLTLGALSYSLPPTDHPLLVSLVEALNNMDALWNVRLFSNHSSDRIGNELEINDRNHYRDFSEL